MSKEVDNIKYDIKMQINSLESSIGDSPGVKSTKQCENLTTAANEMT